MKRQKNYALQTELRKRFGTQADAGYELHIDSNRLSRILNGHIKPNAKEYSKLESALGRSLLARSIGKKNAKQVA